MRGWWAVLGDAHAWRLLGTFSINRCAFADAHEVYASVRTDLTRHYTRPVLLRIPLEMPIQHDWGQ